MKPSIIQFQIGKNGLNPGVLESLALALKNHPQVRISVLKSSGRDRNGMKEIAESIGLTYAHLKAFLVVESGGKGFDSSTGKLIIQFEL